ncbi:MAG: Hydrolase alpha/beta [Pseudomonas sp.]|nr:Hydrolase alpha/beta [Pseudomonas sp.]
MTSYTIFESNNFQLQRGAVLPIARLAYRTLGQLNAAKDNVVLIPSWYSGSDDESEAVFIGPDRAINADQHFIIFTNLLGGGRSSSPSNTPAPFDRGRFPEVTLQDNVRLQHQLLTQALNVDKIKLVTGWSMGAAQAYQWASMYPDMVENLAPVAGAARAASYNRVFLLSMRRALELDPVFDAGYYRRPPVAGLKAFASIYAGWGVSEAFYRLKMYSAFGAADHEDFVKYFWEPTFLKHDANDLLAQLTTWENADISDNGVYQKDLNAALAAIKARTVALPIETDRIFPPIDNQAEVEHIADGECVVVNSIWGHMAPIEPNAQQQIDAVLSQLLTTV